MVSRYGVLSVGGFWIGSWRESYSREAAALFLDSESTDQKVYRSNAGGIRARLQLLGYSADEAERVVKAAWSSRLYVGDSSDRVRPQTLIRDFADEWATAGANALPGKAQERLQSQWGYIWGKDRWALRYVLDRLPEDFPISLDLSDVVGRKGYPRSASLCADARTEELAEATGSLPTIVLTEGSTDVEILEAALEFARPQLKGFVTFLDYGMNPAGSVDSVVKAIRAFGAAGVGNRVIGLLDNDLAGREGLEQISRSPLPPTMKGMMLPDLEIAKTYPAVGTEGVVASDINGKAVSIELFLSDSALKDSSGSYRPVQWTGLVQKFGAYQGALIHKSEAQAAFRATAKAARRGVIDSSDWERLGLLLDHIVANVP